MNLNASPNTLRRQLGVIALSGAAAVAFGGLSAGTASAAPGENLGPECRQFSQNGGATWGDENVITWSQARPRPGGEIKHASFHVKNVCDTPAKLQAYLGEWEVSGNGQATGRATVGSAGGQKAMTGGPGILVAETGRVAKDTSYKVELFIGIPAGTTQQNFTIKPDWAISLEEVDADTPIDPGPGDGGGDDGSLGGLGSSSGSLGDLFGGSQSSKTVPLKSASLKSASLKSPVLRAETR